jgi:hypothetical protein
MKGIQPKPVALMASTTAAIRARQTFPASRTATRLRPVANIASIRMI